MPTRCERGEPFLLLLLFAFVAFARMPLGELEPAHARRAGAMILFRMPLPRRALALPETASAAAD